jgi:hypothetical protein
MKGTYIKLSPGRLQIRIKRAHIRVIFFSIHRHGDESANVERNFDELWVLGERLFILRVLTR